jgi:hypothetical protein
MGALKLILFVILLWRLEPILEEALKTLRSNQ